MKSIKKVGILIMVIMMLVCTNIVGVLAVNIDASGRDKDKDVSLTLIKYDSQVDGEGNNPPLKNIPFKITAVKLKAGAVQGSTDPKDYVIDGTFTTIGTTDANGKIVFSTAGSSKTNTAGQVLPGQGIYMIEEQENATGKPTTSLDGKFIVSLPMANALGTGWDYDVIVYPKNDVNAGPELGKEITSDSNANVINWKYSVIVPADIKDAEELVITDTLDSRLTYVAGSIQGYYTDLDGTKHTLTKDVDYTVAYDKNVNENLVITITKPVGFAELAKALKSIDDTGAATPKLYFTFDTSLATDKNVNVGTIDNGGNLDYTNSDGYKYETKTIPDEKKPETDLFAINVYKINVKGEALKDAEFMLYSDVELTKPITAAKIITDEFGNAYIYGLVGGTYYLSETKAPDGYNKIVTPIEVLVSETTAEAGTSIVKVTVTNSNNFTLPLTGGTGTILFTVGGLLLIGTAITLFVLSRKKNARKDTTA